MEAQKSTTEYKKKTDAEMYHGLDPYTPISQSNVFVRCSFCQRDITNSIQFRCPECGDMIYCGDCMLSGKESATHKKTHSYCVMHNLNSITLFQEGWSALDEMKLLEAGQIFGMGNWEETSNFLGDKSENKCLDHYFSTYINSSTFPLPDVNQPLKPKQSDDIQEEQPVPEYVGPGDDIQGYWPYRQDFDFEYDNDLENIIKDIEITGEEDEKEMNYKLSLLRIFNRRLNDRNEKKKFIFDRGLLDIKGIQAQEKKRTKEEKLVYSHIKPFARFLSKDEYEELASNLITEENLRQRIKELQKHRKNGITTLEQIYEYENMNQYNSNNTNNTPISSLPTPNSNSKVIPLDISSFEDYSLLTKSEKDFCSYIHILPRHYISIKNVILQEVLRNEKVNKENLSKKLQIDINQTKQIYDFYISTSWVKTDQSILNRQKSYTSSSSVQNMSPTKGMSSPPLTVHTQQNNHQIIKTTNNKKEKINNNNNNNNNNEIEYQSKKKYIESNTSNSINNHIIQYTSNNNNNNNNNSINPSTAAV
ncbi:hypothetical protein WA158_007506 [Blastocystis sp. Blastoise]